MSSGLPCAGSATALPRRLADRQAVARQAGNEIDAVVDEMLVDELDHALAIRRAGDVVGAVLEGRNRIGHRDAALRHRQEHVIVLRIADAHGVARRHLHGGEGGLEPRSLGDAARQEHERALVEDERPLHAGLADRRQRGFGERLVGGDDGGADVESHTAATERSQQRLLRGIARTFVSGTGK